MQVAERLRPFGESIFTTMTQLANQHQAINLSQGFPDFDGPDWLKEAAIRAIRDGPNQYAPSPGNPALRRALQAKMQRDSGLDYDPEREITITAGATEAIAAVLLGLLNPGEEVILLEPFYDSYPACVALAGGVAKFLPLDLPHFEVDWQRLEALITPATRALLINTPGNPHGKVWSLSELAQLAELALRHPRLLFVCDEVYEHIVFAPAQHLHLAALADMRSRTLVISSFSKTLSMTGWKVGYVFAPAPLTAAVRSAHQFLTFCSASPLQAALAEVLERLPAYLEDLRQEYQERRDLWCQQLQAAHLPFQIPQGSYFIMSDLNTLGCHDDKAWCRDLTILAGVAAIPASAFYSSGAGRGWVRWAFCKSRETLIQAGQRLAARTLI